MSAIAIAYSGSGSTYNFVIRNFGGNEMPRSYQESASYSQSANGASVLSGPAFRQKYSWAISTVITNTDADLLMEMFESWDTDRSSGLSAAVGLTDQTGPGPSITTNAVFSTAPTFTRMGPNRMMASFGFLEV